MKTLSYLPILAIGILAASAAPSLASSEPKPLSEPLSTLTRGPIRLSCNEPGNLNGVGNGRFEFTLSLAPAANGAEHPVAAQDARLGYAGPDGIVSNWIKPQLDLARGFGQILFVSKTQFERISFEARYEGPVRPGETGEGRIESLTVDQDRSTKLVFVRYKNIAVLRRSQTHCTPESNPADCFDQTRTISDSVYLCDWSEL